MVRIKKNINLGIISWSNPIFSELTLQELYDQPLGELQIRCGSLRIKRTKCNKIDSTQNLMQILQGERKKITKKTEQKNLSTAKFLTLSE